MKNRTPGAVLPLPSTAARSRRLVRHRRAYSGQAAPRRPSSVTSLLSTFPCLPAILSAAGLAKVKALATAGLSLSLSCVLSVFLTACARRETNVESGLRTQTLHIGNRAEPPDLDPQNGNLYVRFIATALFEGLVRLANDGTTIVPGVVERWEISADGLVYTFHLRNDARWSNGERVTASDFLAAFRRFLDPQVGCEDGSRFYSPIVGARDFAEGRNRDFTSVGSRLPTIQPLRSGSVSARLFSWVLSPIRASCPCTGRASTDSTGGSGAAASGRSRATWCRTDRSC